VGSGPADAATAAARTWAALDEPWQEAFRQAWEGLRSGSFAIGACAATADGKIVHAARNRVREADGPHGEVFGSALAHAEINVLARLPFRAHKDLTLTTTLEPCLQCAAAIRLGPVAVVRFAGADRYWDGCHDFGKLSPREARRSQPARSGPRRDELGFFATVIARLGPGLPRVTDAAFRAVGDGPLLDLAHELESGGEVARLTELEVSEALDYLWPRLQALRPRA
jgi:tRNA(Arg) A34 adenosine deaminase TadA